MKFLICIVLNIVSPPEVVTTVSHRAVTRDVADLFTIYSLSMDLINFKKGL